MYTFYEENLFKFIFAMTLAFFNIIALAFVNNNLNVQNVPNFMLKFRSLRKKTRFRSAADQKVLRTSALSRRKSSFFLFRCRRIAEYHATIGLAVKHNILRWRYCVYPESYITRIPENRDQDFSCSHSLFRLLVRLWRVNDETLPYLLTTINRRGIHWSEIFFHIVQNVLDTIYQIICNINKFAAHFFLIVD